MYKNRIFIFACFILLIQINFVSTASGSTPVGSNQIDKIIGTWIGEVSIDNPGFQGFPTMLTFHKGGTMLETHPLYTPDTGSGLGALMATPGHGEWNKIGPRQYKVSFKFFIQGGPGNQHYEGQLIGINNVNYFIELDPKSGKMHAEWSSRLIGFDGIELLSGSGDFNGEALKIEPLP